MLSNLRRVAFAIGSAVRVEPVPDLPPARSEPFVAPTMWSICECFWKEQERLATGVPISYCGAHRPRMSPAPMDEVIADIYDVTAGVSLIIAGVILWYGGGSSGIWGALMIVLGVVVLILNMLGVI